MTRDQIDIIAHRINFIKDNISDNEIILDVGAGSGVLPSILSQSVNFYLALDLLWSNVQELKRVNTCQVLMGDACVLPIRDKGVSVVLAMAMIYYLDFDKFLIEARRVLKGNGKLIFCTSNPEVPTFRRARNTTAYYNVSELNDKLLKLGFSPLFFGAFPVRVNNSAQRLFFIHLKDFIKNNLLSKHTNFIWKWARNYYYGGEFPLLEEELITSMTNLKLPKAIKFDNLNYNKVSRVIYCVATLRK